MLNACNSNLQEKIDDKVYQVSEQKSTDTYLSETEEKVETNLINEDKKNVETDLVIEGKEKVEANSITEMSELFRDFLEDKISASVSTDVIIKSNIEESYEFDGNLSELCQQYYSVYNNYYMQQYGEGIKGNIDEVEVEYAITHTPYEKELLVLKIHKGTLDNRYIVISQEDDALKIVCICDDSERYGCTVGTDGVLTYSGSTSAYTMCSEVYQFTESQKYEKSYEMNDYCIWKNEDGTYYLDIKTLDMYGVMTVIENGLDKYYTFSFQSDEYLNETDKMISNICVDGNYITQEEKNKIITVSENIEQYTKIEIKE